ncbi:MAG TPA: RNA polymerase sigma factor [Candidatus Sulfotelmatobacter sp.]
MYEGRRVAVGEAILSEAAVAPSRERSQDDVLEDLVRQHARLVYRIGFAVLRRHHDAEDATQETFVRVLRYRSKLTGVEDYRTWLARIAWRVAVDRSKRQGRKREVPLDDPEKPLMEFASSDAPADVALGGAQVGEVLEQMITALPEKLRQPLILSTIEEMSPREVSATLGISEAAVRSRIFRARQILREKLERLTSEERR